MTTIHFHTAPIRFTAKMTRMEIVDGKPVTYVVASADSENAPRGELAVQFDNMAAPIAPGDPVYVTIEWKADK